MKIFGLILAIILGILLLSVTADFPNFGSPTSPASTHLSPHFIEETMEETSVPNIVSAVLADYRGFDTMFETAVIFTAGMACFFLLSVLGKGDRRQGPKDNIYYHPKTGILLRVKDGLEIPESNHFTRVESVTSHYDFITSTVSRLLVPFIQIYALYVVAHGHHSPGGGFQGGVILGASFILLAIAFDLRTVMERINEKMLFMLLALGVFFYTLVGVVCMLMGGNFLDYAAMAPLLGVGVLEARSLGILFVEVGVAVTVMATMILIYNIIASRGRGDEGL